MLLTHIQVSRDDAGIQRYEKIRYGKGDYDEYFVFGGPPIVVDVVPARERRLFSGMRRSCPGL